MKWLSIFLRLLPIFIQHAENVGGAGADKKASVTEALKGIAEGVGVISPTNAVAAQTAADVAISTIDGVVGVLKATGAITPKL